MVLLVPVDGFEPPTNGLQSPIFRMAAAISSNGPHIS
jgi:hypothetical protein